MIGQNSVFDIDDERVYAAREGNVDIPVHIPDLAHVHVERAGLLEQGVILERGLIDRPVVQLAGSAAVELEAERAVRVDVRILGVHRERGFLRGCEILSEDPAGDRDGRLRGAVRGDPFG